jgi:hypothetical protein
VTTREQVLANTLIHVSVPVPIKSIELDTTLVSGTFVKEENGMRVTVTKQGDRIKVKTETLPDSVKTVVKLQNERVTIHEDLGGLY